MKRAGVPWKRVRRLAFVSAIALTGACSAERESDEPVFLTLGSDTIVLPAGARITDVHVRATADEELQPAAIEAGSGDVLRFSAEDRGPHALVFDDVLTGPAGLSFLEETHQSRGLPLLESGASWVVTLAGAPAGEYAVRCLTHGGITRITVLATGRAP